MHVDRYVVSDRAVGSVLIVVPTPILQLFPGIRKTHEPVGVQTLRPELAVEGFDEPVVGRFTRSGEVEGGIVGIRPEIEVVRDEFATVTTPDRLRVYAG